jgi:hypothetical protein
MSQPDDVGTTLQKFLAECEVALRVPLHNPPAASQRDLG